MEEPDRLSEALRRAREAMARKEAGKGIGTQTERMLHCMLKYYFEPDEAFQEVRVGRYIADICCPRERRILEIQTRDFGRLRDKLDYFLQEYRVTVVYPIAREKRIFWVDPESGEAYGGRRSPRRGQAWEILDEIYRLPEQQMHENLSFLPVLIDLDEYRLQDGWSRDRKRGAHRLERVPHCLEEGALLRATEDYAALMPDTLPEEFTVKDFAGATGFRGHAGAALTVMERAGAVRRDGKRNRANLYSIRKDLRRGDPA